MPFVHRYVPLFFNMCLLCVLYAVPIFAFCAPIFAFCLPKCAFCVHLTHMVVGNIAAARAYKCACTHTQIRTHAHTHTHRRVCVCVCVYTCIGVPARLLCFWGFCTLPAFVFPGGIQTGVGNIAGAVPVLWWQYGSLSIYTYITYM